MLAKLPGALKQNFIQQMFLSSPEHQRKGILAWFDITHQLIREHVFCILHQRKTDWQQAINRMFVKEGNQISDKITKR